MVWAGVICGTFLAFTGLLTVMVYRLAVRADEHETRLAQLEEQAGVRIRPSRAAGESR